MDAGVRFNMPTVELVIVPRKVMSWEAFCQETPSGSIAFDGFVHGGPKHDEGTLHANLDHHSGVVRGATMSTAMQVYFGLKGNLIEWFEDLATILAHVNDPDQDTSLATWLLKRHSLFLGAQSHPVIDRVLHLNDRWDITAGAFPMALDDKTIREHNWVFSPYTELRKSGQLALADEATMRNTVELIHANLEQLLMGRAKEKPLDDRYQMLHESSTFDYRIVDEIGGNEARYILFSKGLLRRFVSLVARLPNGRFVYTIGKQSQFIKRFPLFELYAALNAAEGLDTLHGWNGSDTVGGSSRERGSGLTWEQVREVIDGVLARKAEECRLIAGKR